MLPGLMQTTPLLISGILAYAAQAHGSREIVSKLIDEPVWRYDYEGLARRSAQLAHALKRLGVQSGDRITSLAWNTHRHLELFYAVPGIGAVLHTANPACSTSRSSTRSITPKAACSSSTAASPPWSSASPRS